jgi:hypothetical protein
MRNFRRILPACGFALLIIAARGNAAPEKDAPPVAGAKLLGKYTTAIATNMDFVSTTAGPRILGLDGLFTGKSGWVVWDGASGKKLTSLPNQRGTLTGGACVPALSPDGGKMALVYRWQVNQFSRPTDQVDTVVYDIKTGRAVFTDRRRGPVSGVVFTPGGALLLFDADSCHVLEPGKDKFTRKFKLAAPMAGAAAVSADDGRLALYASGTLHVYNLAEGKLEFELTTDSKPKKEEKPQVPMPPGGNFPGIGIGFGLGGDSAQLAFLNDSETPKLLINERTMAAEPMKDPKAFVPELSTQCKLRLVDVKEKKQVGDLKLPKNVDCVRAVFTEKGEARALVALPVMEAPPKNPAPPPAPMPKPPVKGPALPDLANVLSPAQTMKFQLIDLTGKALTEFTLTNPPLLVPVAPACLLTADNRFLLMLTTTRQQQERNGSTATVWELEPKK